MKASLFLFLSACMLISSCNLFSNYGKKVEFGQSEVYYKGEGVSEGDAKKLGKYLKEQEYFDGKEKAVQITHDGTDYMIRFVVDKKKLTDAAKLVFWKFQYDISKDVFDDKSVRAVLADQELNDIEVMPPVAKYEIGASGIFYDNSELKKSDAKALAAFLEDAKLFTETNGAVALYRKEDNVPVVRLLVNAKTFKDEMLPEFSFWQEQMKEKLFDGRKAKLLLTSTDLEDLDPLPKLTAQQRQAFENQTTQTLQTENSINTLTTDTSSSGVLRLPNN